VIVARVRQHLNQVADLAVGAEPLLADHELNRPARELSNQALDQWHRGIVRLGHPEDDFVVGIVEQAVAAQALVCLWISTAHRFKNGDGWSEVAARCPSQALAELHRTGKSEEVISRRAQSAKRGHELEPRVEQHVLLSLAS